MAHPAYREGMFPVVRVLSGVLVSGLVLTGMLASPAAAAPGTVSPPIVKASTSTSLTVDWSGVSGATRYQVFYSKSYDGVKSTSTSRKTSGSETELKVTGLDRNTMYCFQVRGLNGSSTGNRSQRHCKMTQHKFNNTNNATASVATFNVCGHASSCNSWTTSRESAVIDRIVQANADVVNIQEGFGRIDRLDTLLTPKGYALASKSGTEAVFYRTAKLELVPEPEDSKFASCDGAECHRAGKFNLGGSATAAWAELKLKANAKRYVFASAHLTSGKDPEDDSARRAETESLIIQAKTVARSVAGEFSIIFAGDFNSNRSRSNDAPRIRFAQSKWYDAYDRSATYTNPNYNSYNGWLTTVTKSVKYGDHVDKIFISDAMGSTTWRVVNKLVSGTYVTPMASDHNPIRATLYLP